MKKFIFSLLYITFFGALLPLVLGFANALHPLFDSLSNFRVHVLVIVLVLGSLLMLLHTSKYRYWHLLLLIIGAIYLYLLTQAFEPSPITKTNKKSFTHMQFNLNFRNRHMDKFKSYIIQNPIDIITLQEVTKSHMQSLLALKSNGTYPYQIYCKFRSVGGGAILSKYPIDYAHAICVQGQGLLAAPITIDEKPITVASLHLFWPYPFSQQKQIAILKKTFEAMSDPTLISGDFNAVAWSDAAAKVAKYSHTKIVDGLRWSIELRTQLPLLSFMKLSIDHLLLSDGIHVEDIEVKEGLGSDHLPIVAKIWY